AEMYKDESKYTPQERQIIGITLAGYYDRLGVPGWARSCLKAVIDECRKSYPDTDSDPWLKDMSGNVQDRVKEAGEQRKSLALEAAFRMKQIEYEIKYLTLSANLIRESLQTNQYPADKIPFFVYLVGEFERRAENFGAAKIWLDAASTMLTEAKEGDYAIDQIEVLKGYYSRLDPKPALEYEGYPADYKLLTEQIKRSRNFIKNGEDVRANVGTGTEKNTVRKPLPK
ncbi:MAG: hypothetical protein JXR97_00870, partial [Planctomycetes bacterium]|nr:hypothetical protein [Planctomycetota bacterium]